MANTLDNKLDNHTFREEMAGLKEVLWEISTSIDHGTLEDKADGTNWTIADSLSNIAVELGRLNDNLEKK